MFLFYHLLLAHVTADLAFQPNELINWKKKSIWGIILHNAIFLVLSIIFCITYINIPIFLLLLLLVTTIRTLIDFSLVKITGIERLDNIITFLVGQFFRILTITPVLFIPQFNAVNYLTGSNFTALYNNEMMLLYLSFFIIVIYGGSFIVHYLKKTFVDPNHRFRYYPMGMIERLFIFIFFVLGGSWLFFIPIVILIKLFIMLSGIRSFILEINEPSMQYQKIKEKSGFGFDLLVNPAFSILMGTILKSL